MIATGLLGLLAALISAVQEPVKPAGPTVTAFVNVAVIPMDSERILAGQTVLVQDGRIAELGPVGQVRVPVAATRIDGKGKYLLPGIQDMHVHIVGDNGHLPILATGVTTLREMLAGSQTLELKERIAHGEVGPRIYTAAEVYANDPDKGEVCRFPDLTPCVARIKTQGYDFIKFYERLHVPNEPEPDSLGRQVFDSLVAAAGRVGIRISGHMQVVGIEHALQAYVASAEHAYGYFEYLTDGVPAESLPLGYQLDTVKLAKIVAETRRAGTWVVPTLAIVAAFSGSMLGTSLDFETRCRLQIIKALHDGGVGILFGTDYGPILREMKWMVMTGLTPYQVLVTATRNPAVFLGTLDRSGTLEKGKDADLVLLGKNPLESVDAFGEVAGVMVGGRWLPRADLDTLVGESPQSPAP